MLFCINTINIIPYVKTWQIHFVQLPRGNEFAKMPSFLQREMIL